MLPFFAHVAIGLQALPGAGKRFHQVAFIQRDQWGDVRGLCRDQGTGQLAL